MSERKPWSEPIVKRFRQQWATPVLEQISQLDERRGSGCVFGGIAIGILAFWAFVILIAGHYLGWW